MDKNSQPIKDVIKAKPFSKEALYYSILFGVSFIIGIVLLVIGIVYKNTNLTVYAGVITPVFLILALVALMYLLKRREAIFVENNTLVIRKTFFTKRFDIAKIKKLTAATNQTDGITSVNISTFDKVTRFKLKNLSKEEISHLRRAARG